jgi:DNA-binding NarL/FixJ family response regulator
MDIHMPRHNGIDATREIVAAAPHIAVLVLTMHEDDESLFSAIRAGARGYLIKGARQAELLRALQTVADGGAVFGPGIARRLVGFFAAAASATPVPFPELTVREREILDLVARGWSNQQIAAQLDISVKTVRNHVSSVFTKIQVVDRAQAIVKAREAGVGGRP